MSGDYKTVPCKSCGTPMIWTDTPKGKRMPLDATTLQRRMVLNAEGQAIVADTFLSHYATCPHADHFRKKARRERAAQD